MNYAFKTGNTALIKRLGYLLDKSGHDFHNRAKKNDLWFHYTTGVKSSAKWFGRRKMENIGERELMIKKDELKKIADSKRLSMANTEKDYLLDILLFNISHELGNTLVLKGGTSLYKLYNLNRFSEDLDFYA